MAFSISDITFALTVILAAFIASRCVTPPNPPPANKQPDRISTHPIVYMVMMIFGKGYLFWGFYHAAVALQYPSLTRAICPHPEHLDPQLFSWTSYSTICTVALLGAGLLRLRTYSQLGADFTLELAVPKRLVTSGMYKYVRHPSYSMWLIVWSALLSLYLRQKGILGCWLPSVIVNWTGADIVGITVFIGIMFRVVWIRVEDEDAMMKKGFGKEWEVWHARTKKLVPGIL